MRVNNVSGASVVVCVLALSACGSPSQSPSSGGAGSGASAAGQSSGGAGGAATNAGSSSGGSAGQGNAGSSDGGAASNKKFGQVLVQSLRSAASQVSVSARFSGALAGSTSVCTRVSEGGCSASTCDEAPADAAAATLVSAGTVTVTSTEVTGMATLEPDATGTYPTANGQEFASQFLGGEHLQIKATGATVPAFEGELSVPLVLLLSQPLYVPSQSFTAPRAQDLSLVWTRGVKDVYLYLLGNSARPDGLPGSASLTCQIPSESGSAVIKSSLLQLLAPDTSLTTFTIGTKVILSGDHSITLGATMPVANPDKQVTTTIILK